MPREEAENADIAVIHKEIAAFSLGEVKVQVDQSRFGLTTQEATQGPILRDLALGTLALLEHTPLQAIGLNLDMEFEIGSEEAWHALGNRLVPKTDWEPLLEQPGMRNVVVEGKRADCAADRLPIRVQPSGRTQWGVLVAVNQHYRLLNDVRTDVRDRHREAIRVLEQDWASFSGFARDAACRLLQQGI